MTIVNIEDFFHPDAGYQINVLSKYLAKFGHDVTIITAETDKIPTSLTTFFSVDNLEAADKKYTETTNVKIIRLPIKAFLSGRAIFTGALKRKIQELSPEILFVHGNDTLTGMWAVKNYRKLNMPLLTDSHMLSMASKNKLHNLFTAFYRKFITPTIIKNSIPVIRTQNDPYVEKNYSIPLKQAPWISYGSDTLLFHPDDNVKRSFRKENGISDDDFVVVYTGKLDESKGGKLLAKAFLKRFNIKRNIILIAVGSTTGEYGKEVEELFAGSENRIIRFPTQKYCDLPLFYQAADLSVFAKQCSLSFYDAQACGLPVLSEDNNINVDRCSHNNGWNFKSGDVAGFREKIEFAAEMPIDKYADISENAYRFIIDNYNYEDKAREYEKIIIDTYNRFKGEKNA